MKPKGKFIVFEGIDGAGKTTLARNFLEELKKRKVPAFFNKEPTDFFFGEIIHYLLKENRLDNKLILNFEKSFSKLKKEKVENKFLRIINEILVKLRKIKNKTSSNKDLMDFLSPFQEQSLFFADRYFDLKINILPKIKKGIWIIQDRYELSSGAYLIARGGSLKEFLKIRNLALKNFNFKPDLNFFIEVNPEIALSRIQKNRKNFDRNEKKKFLKKTSKAYKKIINYFNKQKIYPIVVIDGTKDIKTLSRELIFYLEKMNFL